MKKLSKVIMAGIAGLMLMSGPASGGSRELAAFHAVITGYIDADLNSDPINVGRKNNNNEIIFEDCDPGCAFKLGAFWTENVSGAFSIYANGTNGSACFPPPIGGGDLRHSVPGGTIHLKVMKNGYAKATFFFTAKLDDGEEGDADGQYELVLFDDEGWVGVFPPPIIGNTATMIFDTGDLWEMRTEGRGKFRHIACKGFGDGAMVTILLTRIAIP